MTFHWTSPWDTLSWSSSVERVEEYARIFYNHSATFAGDRFWCNCTERYLGKFCEYDLHVGISSFSQALTTLFHLRTDPQIHQVLGKILCYTTLQCDYGKLCLDWRNICDGQQNCMNGIDEENCDLLELNECEENEYRCLDGSCIAEEYWLDGEFTSENVSLARRVQILFSYVLLQKTINLRLFSISLEIKLKFNDAYSWNFTGRERAFPSPQRFDGK